jgi:eukaryotic-like serine/threonine-protein kinase
MLAGVSEEAGAVRAGEEAIAPRTVRLPANGVAAAAAAVGARGVESPERAMPVAHTAPVAGSQGALPMAANRSRQELVDGLSAGARVGSYELVRQIGRGGAAVVFLARDPRLGRRVAIKLLVSGDAALARRFLVEAQATARCVHENIVVIHEVGAWQGIPFLVLEYLDGPALSEVLAGEPLPLARALELMEPVVRALGCAHRADIVHRDLKPDNIVITRSGVVKVVDFGIAKWFQSEGELDATGDLVGGEYETLSGPGAVVGTLPYMAPEQWRGNEIDARCDFFAVGVILFRMLTGAHPSGGWFGTLTPRGLREWALSGRDVSIAEAAPGLPAAAIRLVDRCLRKSAAERWGSADELLAEIAAVRAGDVAGSAGAASAEECPYPGLAPFTSGLAARFFGRGREVTEALAILRRVPVLAVVGPSGSGKSSLVLAGVAPALHGGAGEVLSLRPGRAPLSALAEVVARRGGQRISEAELFAEPGRLGVILRERCAESGGSLLVVVDQLEEIFTLVEGGEAAAVRRAFLDALLGAADDVSSPIRLALTVRADFLHRAAEHPWLAEGIRAGMLLLAPPDRTSLRAALVGPLEQRDHLLEDEALVEEIVGELERSSMPLPLLQLVGSRLWAHRDREARRLQRQAYRQLGGVHGALAGQADDVLAGLSPGGRKLVRALLLRLVTAQGTRSVVDRADLVAMAPEAGAVLGSLVAARLLVVHDDDEGVELIHEALIEQWPALRGWMLESREEVVLRDRLAGAARQWHEAGRPAGLLWTGESLAEIRTLEARGGSLGGREREFAQASAGLASRATRRRRALVTGALVTLAAVAISAMVALAAVRRAEDEAQQQAEVARGAAAQAQAAERSLSEKVAALEREERERQAAQRAAAANRQIAEERRGQVERSQAELEAALVASEAAAERAKAAAEKERALRQELGEALGREKQRVEELKRQRSKIEQRLQ